MAHQRARGHHVFEFFRCNLLSLLQFEDVFDPIRDLQAAILVQRAHVASAEPAALEGFGVRFVVVELLGEQVPTFETDFAAPDALAVHLVAGHVVGGLLEVCVVLQPQDAVPVHLADVAGLSRVRAGQTRTGRVFGQPVTLANVDAQHDLEPVQHFLLDGRTAGDDELAVAPQRCLELAEYQVFEAAV